MRKTSLEKVPFARSVFALCRFLQSVSLPILVAGIPCYAANATSNINEASSELYSNALNNSEPTQDLGLSEITNATGAIPQQKNTSVTTISSKAWEGRAIGAADVLAALPGIQSYRQGGLGSFQTISIRGIAAKSIIICIDGVPLNDAAGGAVDLGKIDLNQIERIEVYKDHVPAKFGGSGIGGAVNFVTKGADLARQRSDSRIFGKVQAGYGSHNSWDAAVDISASISDSTNLAASASVRHSDNDYEFKNRNGTPYNPNDDFTDRRKNAEFTEYSALVKARMLHANGVFSNFSLNASKSEGGNPGREDFQTKTAGFKGENAQASYRAELPQFFGWLWLDAGITGRYEKSTSHSYYPEDHIGYISTEHLEYGASGFHIASDITASYLGDQLEANFKIAPAYDYYKAEGSSRNWNLSRLSLTASMDASFAPQDAITFGGETSAKFVSDDIHGGKFVLPTATTRLKTAKDRDISLSGSLFAQLFPNSPFGANISLGRAFREPQLMELYGVYPGTVSNPDLKEESSLHLEIGARATSPSGKSTLKATYYATRSENGIYWITSGSFMKPMNIGKTSIYGIEAELESRPASFLDVILRSTFQKTEDQSDEQSYRGKMLPYEPKWAFLAEAHLQLPYKLDFTWTSEYRTQIYSDRGNRIEQPGTANHRASLGYAPFEQTHIMFAVNNISDATYRNTYTPYPTPGREYKLTISQGF